MNDEPDDIKQPNAITMQIARLHKTTIVLNRGVLFRDGQDPVGAYCTFNMLYGQQWVWAFTGRNGKLENHVPNNDYLPLVLPAPYKARHRHPRPWPVIKHKPPQVPEEPK